ncbi:hypothetical protein [Nitratidesulfovibrio sp. 1201_IL3209]|uniref:hypothetical protein n=1 Tax=Nitratidesulfovibrio sp. 1201_IL3209 TaxID=3084053 RepID=UPI002FD9BFC5
MNQYHRYAITLQLANDLRDNHSWCGETHLQKSMYFLEALAKVPTELGFTLYKHGPYSFSFHDLISEMKDMDLIEPECTPPYGPRYKTTERGKTFLNKFSADIAGWKELIAKTARCLGDKKVQDLEKVGTALLIDIEKKTDDIESRAARLSELKPHVPLEEARRATQEYEKIKQCFA